MGNSFCSAGRYIVLWDRKMRGILFITIIATLVVELLGHGRLMNPPSRASEWRLGFKNPKDYNDNEGFCGGQWYQVKMKGKCGICGDPWDAKPRQHEAPGGRYANGIIVANYRKGQDIDVAVDLTKNHWGHFTFRLCPNNNIKKDPKQRCFNKHVLQTKGPHGEGERYPIPKFDKGWVNMTVTLPADVTCDQCILQWTYKAGNTW